MGRPPAVGASGMVSASNPFATRAALRMLEAGGNAVDAAIAGFFMLCVVEPMNIGVGGDAFALVARDGHLSALDAAGPAPARIAERHVDRRGPRSVTVPGAVGGLEELSRRHGRLGFDRCLAPAIDAATQGLPVCARAAALWSAEDPCPPELGPPEPRPGDVVGLPRLGQTLRCIAEEGADALYHGPIAQAIASASWLEQEDLARYRPRWVEPLRARFAGHWIVEMPPPTQGVIALEALRLLDESDRTLPDVVRAVLLALEDGAAHVRDGAEVGWLLTERHLAMRRGDPGRPVAPMDAGTSHLCVVDRERTWVSMIGSLFGSFGSGVAAPGTGVVLQNRGACFGVSGEVSPGLRPFHTIIPAMITAADGAVTTAFGVVGGHLQAQAHVQLVLALLADGLDPQAALDRSRFRIEGSSILLEEGLWSQSDALLAVGLQPVRSRNWMVFGSGQVIVEREGRLFGGADPRMDGDAAGL